MKAVAVIVAVFLVTFALDHYVVKPNANKKKPPITMAYDSVEKQWAKEYNIYGPLPQKP